jgi:ferritin-like metal-binding protein YciE
MQNDSLRELYIDELRGLYNAEIQLGRALPKMAKAASNDKLRKALEEHLRQTSEHVSRLEQIFEHLEQKPSGKRCLGMQGLVKEAAATLREGYTEDAMDSAIICAGQRVEHYEMAGYRTVRALAELLGESEHVSLFEQTLREEKQADKKLTDLSEEIYPKANRGAAHTSAESPEDRHSVKPRNAA